MATESTEPKKWDCKVGTPDEDHEYERQSMDQGDGIYYQVSYWLECVHCGKQIADEGEGYDGWE